MVKRPFHGSPEYIKPFNRKTYSEADEFTFIGKGKLGGKGCRFAEIKDKIVTHFRLGGDTPIPVRIPRLVIITTEYFERFIKKNKLESLAYSDADDEEKTRRFLEGKLSKSLTADLQVLVEKMQTPLAVRSSSLLEDCVSFPFAGVFKTKMLPNNHPDPSVRLRRLSEAVKYVYASTFFRNAQAGLKAVGHGPDAAKMAVVIQEVVGRRHKNRFYPNISGIARSYNFYPSGHAKPRDGVVHLALGLGRSIVEGGPVWTYSPEYPEVNPPYETIDQMLKQTQLNFWAINMDTAAGEDPVSETKYLTQLSLKDAEEDNTLYYIASTYDFEADRINIGIGFSGARVINFAPILQVDLLPINQVIKSIIKLCEVTFNSMVELEFAVTFDPADKLSARFSLLQVRAIDFSTQQVDLDETQLKPESVLAGSDSVMGNGQVDTIKDIVYVNPETFQPKHSPKIAEEVDRFNRHLVESNGPYLLIGFGRWGTSNPWWGVPVNWGQICGAKVIVESTITGSNADLSQGSHFFHNITNLEVLYFSVRKGDRFPIDWDWLKRQKVVDKGKFVTHVRLDKPLTIKADGRRRKGVILK